MDNQTFKAAYISHLKQIRMKQCSFSTKVKLIEGLMEKLRFMHNNPELMSLGSVQKSFVYHTPSPKKSLFSKKQTASENQSTSYSFYSDNSQILPSPQDYEQKIMEKRVIKFQINQQIQALEDDLFEIQKVVETKRLFNDELAKNITKRMKDIGEGTKMIKEEGYMPKTSTKLPHKREDKIFDMMNITVSGTAGFGFVNKGKEVSNSSLNTSISINRNDMSLGQISILQSQRKKAKSHIGKSITGIFKNILK